ncbi:N-acetylmuramoyl-L-alanine amidase [Roseobacter sp.]|uniref:N-acetylmuramoyl-L-alanine amidase n=1 Tax=Roseobacter sp. TaxID=1907202 RepID=UPI0025F7E872|nr:N-acetylmuramoyl-L-alanine amidase [Roseobacter sp.]
MIRQLVAAALVVCVTVFPAGAEQSTGYAGIDVQQSGSAPGWFGRTGFQVSLSRGVPYRVFTLDNPARLVIDFRETDWTGVRAGDLQKGSDLLQEIRFGVYQPGWSRLVASLAEPALPRDIGMAIDPGTGRAMLQMTFHPTTAEEFAAAAGVPDTALWPREDVASSVAPKSDDRFVVAVDPGHGGIDPGAERDGVTEKELMLEFAFELREVLDAAGVRVALTRDRDVFVSLNARVARAHQARADVFLSLHADALEQGGAHGATVYVLSEEASDKASGQLAARHNRADIIAGADLTGSDDQVAGILLDLARQETEPRTDALAALLIRGMTRAGGPMNSRPLRRAGFSVLKSADIPSVLIEVGFLSSARDLENLRRPEWRAQMVGALAESLLEWRAQDLARRALLRQ